MYIHHFSISPYSVEIIELSVFFREQMHDNILIVHENPCRVACSLYLLLMHSVCIHCLLYTSDAADEP